VHDDPNATVETAAEGSVTVIRVAGELDAVSGAELRSHVSDALESSDGDVVVDLGRVEFVDSSGLGVLVGGLKRCQQQDRGFRLRHLNPKLDKIFGIAGLSRVFELEG